MTCRAVTAIEIITLDGEPVAVVAGGVTIIEKHVTGELLTHVQAKALYALEIQAGERAGPSTDAGAERFAHQAAARRR